MGFIVVRGVNININSWGINCHLKDILRVSLNYLSSPHISLQPQQLHFIFNVKDNRVSSFTLMYWHDNAFMAGIELLD